MKKEKNGNYGELLNTSPLIKLILDELSIIQLSIGELKQDISELKSSITEIQSQNENSLPKALDVFDILNLPKHLQDTAKALLKSSPEDVTADNIAEITQKKRAVESDYLNQLVNLGYSSKKRVGRKVYFFLK